MIIWHDPSFSTVDSGDLLPGGIACIASEWLCCSNRNHTQLITLYESVNLILERFSWTSDGNQFKAKTGFYDVRVLLSHWSMKFFMSINKRDEIKTYFIIMWNIKQCFLLADAHPSLIADLDGKQIMDDQRGVQMDHVMRGVFLYWILVDGIPLAKYLELTEHLKINQGSNKTTRKQTKKNKQSLEYWVTDYFRTK